MNVYPPLPRVVITLELLGTRVPLFDDVGHLTGQVVILHAVDLLDLHLVQCSPRAAVPPSQQLLCRSSHGSLVSSVRRGTSRVRSRAFAALPSWPECPCNWGMLFTILLDRSSCLQSAMLLLFV